MNKEHFEPVTARSLAGKLYNIAHNDYYDSIQHKNNSVSIMESIIDPHIRKPSDEAWMKRAAFILQRVIMVKLYGGNYALSTEIRDEIREFLNAEPESINRGTSVTQRCEEAYNEAIRLLLWYSEQSGSKYHSLEDKWKNFTDTVDDILKQPNPFLEAGITDKGEDQQKNQALLPFDLKTAQEGFKVVTAGNTPVKILCDDLSGEWPILATYTDSISGCKRFDEFNTVGQRKDIIDDSLNLFILKEPEVIKIYIFRDKLSGSISSSAGSATIHHGEELIKTIIVEI